MILAKMSITTFESFVGAAPKDSERISSSNFTVSTTEYGLPVAALEVTFDSFLSQVKVADMASGAVDGEPASFLYQDLLQLFLCNSFIVFLLVQTCYCLSNR